MKEIDGERIEKAVKEILLALGGNPNREGLVETPKRVANMYKEVFRGMCYSNEEIAEMFNKCFTEDTNDLVLIKDIECFSHCEHHLALMYNMTVSVAYIPSGKVIGLSKVARIADMVCKRLQLQERIGNDIADILTMILGTEDVAVFVKAEHSCMTTRGIRARGARTVTHTLRGIFQTDKELRGEIFTMLDD